MGKEEENNTGLTEIEKLNKQIEEQPDNSELYYYRADLYFQQNILGKAINDYRKVLELEPEHKVAKGKVELLSTILRYNNTDIYASPNTDMDPWLEQ